MQAVDRPRIGRRTDSKRDVDAAVGVNSPRRRQTSGQRHVAGGVHLRHGRQSISRRRRGVGRAGGGCRGIIGSRGRGSGGLASRPRRSLGGRGRLPHIPPQAIQLPRGSQFHPSQGDAVVIVHHHSHHGGHRAIHGGRVGHLRHQAAPRDGRSKNGVHP